VAGQTFLQVAAVKRPQAEVLVELLKKKGFRAIMSPVTVDGQEIFRTLVGPVKDASDLAKTKAGLESAGLKAIVKKY
jgi:cell division septation protein DedD